MWKIVPVKPSGQMVADAFESPMPAAYTAMLAASPCASEDEELVEKVAEMMFCAVRGGNDWSGVFQQDRDDWRYAARAVLKALEG